LKDLPKKLGKEPLIDVICGVNFTSEMAADRLLPGLLLSKLSGKQLKFEALPASQLPQAIREHDPNLQNAPLMRVIVDEQFAILIGAKWLGVGCLMPYAGWSDFKDMIRRVFSILRDAPFITSVERHSLKYVDFIEGNGDEPSLKEFNLELTLGNRKITNESTQLRTEIVLNSFIHAVSIVSKATVTRKDNITLEGAVVEVDTHRLETFTKENFLNSLSSLLDEIHLENKAFFFDLLSAEGLKRLEPKYD
jgi:uncharacterized protein (TIGR04255 family)